MTVGLCHANIKKIEQLHMMPDITHNITSANNQMQETLELSQQGFKQLDQQLGRFRNKAGERFV